MGLHLTNSLFSTKFVQGLVYRLIGDRTQNLWFRRSAPYSLGHRVINTYIIFIYSRVILVSQTSALSIGRATLLLNWIKHKISGFVDQRLIHWATESSIHKLFLLILEYFFNYFEDSFSNLLKKKLICKSSIHKLFLLILEYFFNYFEDNFSNL